MGANASFAACAPPERLGCRADCDGGNRCQPRIRASASEELLDDVHRDAGGDAAPCAQSGGSGPSGASAGASGASGASASRAKASPSPPDGVVDDQLLAHAERVSPEHTGVRLDPETTPEPFAQAQQHDVQLGDSINDGGDTMSELSGSIMPSPHPSEADDSDGSDCSRTSATHFRGHKRRSRNRLLVTHTMGLQPSSALQLIIESSDDIHAHYELDKKILGQGAFGVVRRGKIKLTGAVRAVKAINKKKMKTQSHLIKQEINIMKMLDHPNLLMLFEVTEDHSDMFLVLEMCTGGTLTGKVVKLGVLPEPVAARVMQQILRATLYLHKHDICHRDLKADNVLIDRAGPLENSTLKIADFGLSCIVPTGKLLIHPAGTPSHMAPEVYAKRYHKACDLWSNGVIGYLLLCGYLPFHAANKEELQSKIIAASVDFNSSEWLDISQAAVDFILGLLAKNAKTRFSASRALSSKWIKERVRDDGKAKMPLKVIDDLRKFRLRNKLKRAALHVIASMLPEDDIREMRKAFIQLDRDGDGCFTIAELKECIARNVFVHEGSAAMIDINSIGQEEGVGFSYTEFIAATIDLKKAARSGLCRAAFASFDKNHDGGISISELATGKMLGQLTAEEIMSTMEALDCDGDCTLDYGEFMTMMRGSTLMSLPDDDLDLGMH